MALSGQATFDPDMVLVERFLAGEKAAFDELFACHKDRVYAIAYGVLGNQDDALDAVQEAFTQVHKHLRRFDGRSRFSTWLYRIAVNSAIQATRRAKTRPKTVPLEDALSTSTTMTVKIQDPRIHEALKTLSANDRALLVLFYWEELPLQEIADVTGCSPNAAKTRLFRARERFKEVFVSLGGEAAL